MVNNIANQTWKINNKVFKGNLNHVLNEYFKESVSIKDIKFDNNKLITCEVIRNSKGGNFSSFITLKWLDEKFYKNTFNNFYTIIIFISLLLSLTSQLQAQYEVDPKKENVISDGKWITLEEFNNKIENQKKQNLYNNRYVIIEKQEGKKLSFEFYKYELRMYQGKPTKFIVIAKIEDVKKNYIFFK